MSSVRKIRVGDFVTVNVKKWLAVHRKTTKDAQYEIIEVNPEDPTILVGEYDGIKYRIFAESVIKIFRKTETFVLS